MDMLLRRLLFLGLCLAGATGSAQSLTLSLNASSAERIFVGRSACSTRFSFTWAFNSSSRYVCSTGLQVWASAGACASKAPNTEDRTLFSRTSTELLAGTGTVSATSPLADWPKFKEEEGTPCGEEGPEGVRLEHSICGVVLVGDANLSCNENYAEGFSSKQILLIYKTTRPPAPTIESASGYDGQASVHFSAPGEDLDRVVLSATRSDGTGDTKTAEARVEVGSVRISGLEDNVPYTLHLKAIDLADNESPLSEPLELSTIPTNGFWEVYKHAGGEAGGCHAAGGGSLAGLALALLGFFAARRLC